jgi:[protein-PII] uridylyltransferase
MNPGLVPTAALRLRDELAALDLAYSPGHHGRWSARRRAELVDLALAELFAAQTPPDGVALVALGGYGRGILAPASDVDLLVLHGDARDVGPLAEALLYPLWDLGLTVGHAVRTPDECLVASVDRLDTLTATLDARLVAGDAETYAHMRGLVLGWVREDPGGFAARLLEAAEQRRQRFGSVSRLLEPDLKEGAGGLRDIQSLGWLAIVIGERPDTPTLDGVGLLRQAERDALDDAEEFLVRVRSALHLAAGRHTDRLRRDQQPALARDMGFVDQPGLSAVDALMRALFGHARQVEHVENTVFERFLGPPGADELPELTPAGVMQALASAAERGRALSFTQLDRLQTTPLPDPIEWSAQVRDAFLRLLRAGEPGVRALEAMDRIELLERFLPEWSAVRCRPQRDPYHRYSVDVHLLEALRGMGRLLDEPVNDDPMVSWAVAQVADDRDAMLLGALLHDIGKTGEGNHVPVGARVAREVLDRMRVERPAADLVAFMVREHLLISDTATRRDLGDEDLILGIAARVGAPERLAALFLLTVADARATGPSAWTPWRRALVGELVAKVQRVLERGEMGDERAERLLQVQGALRERLSGEAREQVEAFLDRVPRGYLLAVPPELAAEHFAMMAAPVGAHEVRTASGPAERPGAHRLTVIAADRPGLLSWVAGALALAGLSILSAQVFTTTDDLAVDLFEVEGSFEPEVGEERWRQFRHMLRRAIEGRISLEHLVDEKRRSYPPPPVDPAVTVDVDDDASDFFTVIEVGAPDRIGLLFDLTRTLAELELDVHLAKVATYEGRVVDAFYVRDTAEGPILDTKRLAAIRRALVERIDRPRA